MRKDANTGQGPMSERIKDKKIPHSVNTARGTTTGKKNAGPENRTINSALMRKDANTGQGPMSERIKDKKNPGQFFPKEFNDTPH
jgi:hypothetical protein